MSEIARCILVLVITAVLFLYEVWGSYSTGSRGVLSDALHMLGDGFPFALQLYLLLFVSSIHETHRLQSRIRKYNFWFLSITALVLFSVAAWRFAWPKPIEPGMLHFALVALVGNGAQFFLAHGFERSQLLHLFADVCASAGVVLAALIIRQTGYVQADTWVTLAIACITAWAAWQCKKTPGGVHIHCHHHGHHH